MARRRRTRTAVLETHAEESETSVRDRARTLPWRATTALSAVGTALASWIIVTAFCSLGWLSQSQSSYAQVLEFGTHAWLLGHGVPMTIEGVRVSVIPLGFALLVMLVTTSFVMTVARHLATRAFGGRARTERQDAEARGLALRMTVWFTVPYMAILAVAASATGESAQIGRALIGGLVICGPITLITTGRALGWSVISFNQGGWIRGVIAGVWSAVAALIGVAALVLLIALIARHGQVGALHNALNPGGLGGAVLAIGQAAWVPNAVLWTAAWLLGAGFTVGDDTLLTPLVSRLGPTPDFPILGALPSGAAPSSAGLAWLLVGVLAGALGAFVAVRARHNNATQALPPRRMSIEAAALCGVCIGVLSGLLACVLIAFSDGSLGVERLRRVGPMMARVVVLAPTLMGAGGLLAGYGAMHVFKLIARRGAAAPSPAPQPAGTRAKRPSLRALLRRRGEATVPTASRPDDNDTTDAAPTTDSGSGAADPVHGDEG
ncbi:cell division protein PerM [Propionibacterium freudenreichii]|uniref:cell division protein PerM n=1 Tax=Propionibacterium freudenreichii TaxID=1744 RepID=UPI000A668110|nr:DUF6350 family protein [Propionibacterium freudenreichii]SBN43405.1 Hypothetical protein PFR_J18_1067 [Propionibacterium freudenreichii]SCQ74632.1 Hypothetical protein PFR_JS20-1_1527 [Propionibacterium freudenreichii]SCQ82682.1 Hypothetical protein PFR_JS20-2_1534 [Propionibacterium freudenreichii]